MVISPKNKRVCISRRHISLETERSGRGISATRPRKTLQYQYFRFAARTVNEIISLGLHSYFCGWGEEYEKPDSRGSRGCRCCCWLWCRPLRTRLRPSPSACEARRARSARPGGAGAIRSGPGESELDRRAGRRPGRRLADVARLCRARLAPLPVGCAAFRSALCSETPFSFTGDKTSATGGGFVGYRIQLGTMVVGIEGDANAKSASSSYTSSDSNTFRYETFTGSVKQGADGSIRGRFGFLVTPSWLVYGTGGVAFGSVSGSYGYTANSFGCCASATGGGSWSTTRYRRDRRRRRRGPDHPVAHAAPRISLHRPRPVLGDRADLHRLRRHLQLAFERRVDQPAPDLPGGPRRARLQLLTDGSIAVRSNRGPTGPRFLFWRHGTRP